MKHKKIFSLDNNTTICFMRSFSYYFITVRQGNKTEILKSIFEISIMTFLTLNNRVNILKPFEFSHPIENLIETE